MKGSEFINLLRKVIREEVEVIVKKELKSIKIALLEGHGAKQTSTKLTHIPTKQITKVNIKQAHKPSNIFTGPLASILNETAASMTRQPAEEEWPEMNGETLTSDNVPMTQRYSTPSQNFSGDPTQAFMKDYSAVMKAADEHASKQR